MTCEWAEGYLSAYLDDALDPQLRKDVGAHIEQCAHCQALAEEYRRNDSLLRTLTPLTPPDDLHQRIFESPAFAALTRELEREGDSASPGRAPSRRVPLYLRAMVPAAALLTISLGAALLFRQGLLPFGAQTASQKQTNTIGGPGSFSFPLSAGPRLVFLNGGALWSIAEHAPGSAGGAPGVPQRLTADGARIVAWSVSPLTGRTGGARIAYIDGRTGALHVVHSDGQADTIIGSVAPTQSPSDALWSSPTGRATLAGLTWSPDGARLAYIAADADGGSQARIYTLDVSGTTTIATNHSAPISQLTWSADSRALAFATTTTNGAPALMVWRGAGQPLATTPASSGAAQASVAQIGWSGSTVTWATTRNGSVTGVYTLAKGATVATRLTPTSASYSAAAFTSARGGVWLLAERGALVEARLATGGISQGGALSATATHIVWSPDGTRAAVVFGDQIALWSDADGLAPLATGVVAHPSLAWSSDGASLAVAQGQTMTIYRASDSVATLVERLTGGASPIALAWAADRQAIVLAESQGMLLVSSDGASQTLLTSRLPDDSALRWSNAG
ncbi:MAG TPA: zf-HC2 domain-containing protein [Ktedonobacterales bacterium]